MAAKGTIGGKIVLEGEKAYREALRNIKAEQSELRSEMNLCRSSFRDSQNSLEALTQKHEILTKQIDTQTQKVEVYRKAMEASMEKQRQAAEKANELRAALEKAEKETELIAESSGKHSEAAEEQAKAVQELREKLKLAEESYGKAGERAQSYKTAMNNATVALDEMKDELSGTAALMKEAEAASDKCATSIDAYGKEVTDAAGKTSVFGDVLKANLASEAVIAGIKKIAGGIRQAAQAALETGQDFEASMSQVAATMGMTAEEINAGSAEYEKLANAAKACGKETKFSASESAEALNYLALAGYNVDKSVETLPKVLDLAAAGGLDLAYASDLVTDSMAALNMESRDLDKYIDGMARTSQKSNTSVAQLGEATLVCAGAVSLTGQKLETMNAELGILANNGLKGAEGGTHLRNIIMSLAAPTEQAETALHSLGVQVEDSEGNMRDLNDIMTDLNAALSGMSSTEKSQIISRIFNKTDIAAVNSLLKGTGQEFDSLVDELKNCTGAAANMAATMNNNLKGKVTVLKSALEGLGISTHEIFDQSMKRAVDGATDAVGRLQNSIERGELGVSLNKLADSFGEFCENAIDVGEDALPVLIDGLTWLMDHTDLVIAGITGIAAANLEMKVAAPAIEAAQAAWTAYKKANEGATVSQWLLNTAMSANPAGILVTAVVGLTAAVAAFVLVNKDNLSVMDETSRATREMVENTREMNAEYEAGREAREQSRTGMEQEQTAAKKLVDELEVLQAKTKLTATEEARQKQIIQELNTVYPELNLQIDEQSGLLNMSADAIYKNIDALAALDRANAAREDMAEIAEQQWEAEKQLLSLREQLIEQEEVLAEKQAALNEEYAEFEGKSGDAYRSFDRSLITSRDTAKAAYDDIQQSITETEASIADMTEEYQFCYEYISENEALYQAADATAELGDAALETGEALSGMADSAEDAFQEMYNSISESVKNQLDLFSEFNEKTELSKEDLLKNMQSQVDGITNWADNLELLAERGINQGLLKHLAEMGPEGAGYVSTFVEMTEEELDKAGELFEQSLMLSEDTAQKVMGAYEEAGKNAAAGFKDGIKDGAGNVAEEAGSMAHGSITTVMEVLDENSPSKEFEKIGLNVDLGMVSGIKKGRQNVLDTITELCSAVLQKGRGLVTESVWQEVGRNITDGMRKGIEEGTAGVVKAAEEMAERVISAAQSKLDIHSPSKKFEWMGEMSGEGYIVGWKHTASRIADAIEESIPGDSPSYGQNPGTRGEFTEGKIYEIQQEINIYSMTDDPIEAAKKFKDSQREAAEEW